RGVTKSALPLKFPLGFLESMERMDKAEKGELRSKMRAQYAVHYSELGKVDDEGGEGEQSENQIDQHETSNEIEIDERQSPKKKSDDGTAAADKW
ncbi:MAG: hypothetical protein AAF429_08165, partial [Pseudomonadota bacterium]